jgi:hypothetical protein
MKKIKILSSIFALFLLFGCTDESNDVDLSGVAAPENIDALFKITQDNTGKVTILPSGEGVSQFEINFGDGTTETSYVSPGNSIDHIYTEGVFPVKIIGWTINGLKTEVTKNLTVTFTAPTDLAVTISPVAGNNLSITLEASANFETFFQVYFGDNPNALPVDFMEGDVVTHVYPSIGTYAVKVVALSGGVATTEVIQNITITDPLLLPIDFESPTLNYNFLDFGGATTSVINNPVSGTGNTSAKVGKVVRQIGSEVYAGSFITLSSPIDLSTLKKIKMKSFAPASGIQVIMKLENSNNSNINVENTQINTTSNAWEDLIFDFTAANTSNTYDRIVIFFNFGVQGNGSTYYFDDLVQSSGTPALALPINFESTSIPYVFTDFGGNIASVETNSVSGGINTSNKVGKILKGNGALSYAGSTLALTSPLDLSSMKKIKMKVWSPAAGIVVKMKLENQTNANLNIEVDATTTVANAWQELTFDFAAANNANNLQKVIIFFDFGALGTGTSYYFDDIIQTN